MARLGLATVALLLLSACAGEDALDRIQTSGELVIATRNGPTTYFINKGEAAGFEYELVSMFAEELGVSMRFVSLHNIADIFDNVRRGQVDLAAAGLTVTPAREAEFSFSNPYYDIDPQIVYVAGSNRPRSVEDLYDGRLITLDNSSHAETLRRLQVTHPELQWTEVRDVEPLDLMDMVNGGAATWSVVDSNEFVANSSFYPKLRVGFNLSDQESLAWLLADTPDNTRLLERVNDFLRRVEEDGHLAQLKERQFGHAWEVNPVDSQTFNRRMRNRLPKYQDLIQEVADEYQLDWHLLAAISYQESHWNPYARSPTGVRGMMMLTSNTAREMGTSNRLDAAQSLRGGARYFKKIKRLLPADVYEPDRTWFALAAYNIGRGHLEDARIITERQGGDPHLWVDVKQRLPLLQRSKYYKKTRHGYARGSEPVTYVKNIRHYFNILAWQDINANRPPAPVASEDYVPEVLRNSSLSAL
ncbi:MAG: membrane-bound lytic murein transglycosylase MltF [Halieaceae bacterium]